MNHDALMNGGNNNDNNDNNVNGIIHVSSVESSTQVYWELSSYARGRIRLNRKHPLTVGECITVCSVELEERAFLSRKLESLFVQLQDDLVRDKFA